MRWYLCFLLLCCGCNPTDEHAAKHTPMQAALIDRDHAAPPLELTAPDRIPPPSYAWDKKTPWPVTQHFFRCRGSALHPAFTLYPDGEDPISYLDCDGLDSHGLPAREGKEFIYPILIELLNYIQQRAERPVIITCGHRCPQHNDYADPSVYNRTSKHQIGAEVDFYVDGMETEPERIVGWIQEFYSDKGDLAQFERYEKEDTNVRTAPWYNKEVFVKLFEADEGRDRDNAHGFAYVGIQVRWDRDTKERVLYSWQQAHRGYFRKG